MTAVTFRREQEVTALFAGLPMISILRRQNRRTGIDFSLISEGVGLQKDKDWFIT